MNKIHLYIASHIDFPFLDDNIDLDKGIKFRNGFLAELVQFLYIDYQNLIRYGYLFKNYAGFDEYRFRTIEIERDKFLIHAYRIGRVGRIDIWINKENLLQSNIEDLETLSRMNPNSIQQKYFFLDTAKDMK